MNVPIELFEIAFVLLVVVLPIIVLVRLAAGDGDFGFDALIRADTTLPWPKGVQEEEPKPWRFGPAVRVDAPAVHPARHRVGEPAATKPAGAVL